MSAGKSSNWANQSAAWRAAARSSRFTFLTASMRGNRWSAPSSQSRNSISNPSLFNFSEVVSIVAVPKPEVQPFRYAGQIANKRDTILYSNPSQRTATQGECKRWRLLRRLTGECLGNGKGYEESKKQCRCGILHGRR